MQHSLQKTIKDHKNIFGFVLLVVILISVSILIKKLTPPTQIVSSEPWKNLNPGSIIANTQDLSLGATHVEEKDRSTIYSYESPYPMFPNQVIVETKTNTLTTTIEMMPPDKKQNISSFLAEFGEPDLIAFYPKLSRTARANVFLAEGVIVISHATSGSVEQIWRTLPTTEEIFWKRFQHDFTKGPPGPETFDVVNEEV